MLSKIFFVVLFFSMNAFSKPTNLLELAQSYNEESLCLTMAKKMIKNGADLEYTGTDSTVTPLFAALETNKFKLANYFIDQGAKINVVVRGDESPLLEALKHYPASNALILKMLSKRANPNLIPTVSILAQSIQYKVSDEIFQKLLDKGADIGAKSSIFFKDLIFPNLNVTPLMVSAYYGKLTKFKMLLEKGAGANDRGEMQGVSDTVYLDDLTVMDAAVVGKQYFNTEKNDQMIKFIKDQHLASVTNRTLYMVTMVDGQVGADFINSEMNLNPQLSLDEMFPKLGSAGLNIVENYNYILLAGLKGRDLPSIMSMYEAEKFDNILGALPRQNYNMAIYPKNSLCTAAALALYYPKLLNPSLPIRSPLFSAIQVGIHASDTTVYFAARKIAKMMVVCGADLKLRDATRTTPIQSAGESSLAEILNGAVVDAQACADYFNVTFECLK